MERVTQGARAGVLGRAGRVCGGGAQGGTVPAAECQGAYLFIYLALFLSW